MPADPPWLTRLRDALLADDTLPAVDEAFTHEDVRYVCHRRVDYDHIRLTFHEVWLDPQTYRPAKSWQAELEAGAWAGPVPESVFRQQVVVLVTWLNDSRPRTQPLRFPLSWLPGRFARQGPRR
jgi:hypothetical protein